MSYKDPKKRRETRIRRAAVRLAENPERERELRAKRNETSAKWRVNNREKEHERLVKQHKTARIKVVEALGRACTRCGMTHSNLSFLDIDHINGRIHPDDKTPSGKRRSPTDSARRALERGEEISARFQLLCPNCHRLKTLGLS